ncbi:hypothetical protein FRB91_007564 [Serendipita sp. 411]|nr:hypothetical protein FRB91_007564 [Serendipita sp. 411]
MSNSEQQNVHNTLEHSSTNNRHETREDTLRSGQHDPDSSSLSMNNGSNEPTTSLPTASHEANHPSTANLTAASTGTTPGTGGSLPGDSRFISTLLIRHSYSIIALLSPQTSTVPTDTPTTGSGISASHSAGEPASTPRVPTSFTNRMDSWIYDPASGRFVPHQLPAGVAPFGPLDTNANPRPAPGPSTTNSVFPDNPSLPGMFVLSPSFKWVPHAKTG